MTIRARLNAKGQIAASGAAKILGRHLTLGKPDTLDLDVTGFAVGLPITGQTISAGEGLSVTDNGVSAGIWSMTFEGTGAATLTFRCGVREWSGRVAIGT